MTVTLGDPPGPIASRYEPLNFSATREIISISVEINPASGTGPRECVYDGTDDTHANGTFSYPYRNSQRTGNDWTIEREGGWPAPVQLRIKEAPLPASSTLNAALQPTLYSPLAQWALQGAPDTGRLWLDRSGNARHLTSGNGSPATDLIPGQTAVLPSFATRLKRSVDAALQLHGAMTFTCRVKRLSATYGALIVCSGIFNSNAVNNTLYALNINPDGTLTYGWESSTGTLSFFTSTLTVPVGSWTYISFRRNSASTGATWGVNGSYQTSGTLAPVPSGGSSAFVTLGDVDEAIDSHLDGALSDACLWGASLTDDEITPLRNAALGL